mgnify:CR=1 FL=1
MRAPHDVQTVSGSNAATISEGAAADDTRGGVPPVGPTTAGMIGREILGQYRVLSKLGRGGMGTVFLAQQIGMNRQVAIKVLHQDVSADPDAARRFQVEAQAAARLSSPHIVSVYNFGRLDSGELYLAMEFLQGKTLHSEIATYGQLALGRVVELVAQIARGLQEAHRNGVIHRDLKPGNVMLVPSADGEVPKLLDFGIAKLDAGTGTQTQGWVGTPRYMAPEQFTGGAIDARTDVYALGLITYEMLCGRTPFLSDNPMSYVHSHVYSSVPSMQSVAPGAVPSAVETVVLSALAKNPQQRPGSAIAFAERLAAAVHAPRTSTRKGSTAAPAIAAGVLATVLVGGAGAWAYQRFVAEPETVPSEPESVASASPPASMPTAPTAVFDPEYLDELPEEFRELVELDEKALMKRLEESFYVYPPSMRKQTKAQYTLHLAASPGPSNVAARKMLLINAIVAMSNSKQYFPNDPRTTEELVEQFLESEGPLPLATRKELLDNMRTAVPNAEDADWTIRQWLLQYEQQQKTQ